MDFDSIYIFVKGNGYKKSIFFIGSESVVGNFSKDRSLKTKILQTNIVHFS